MSYCLRNDGLGWRTVGSAEECAIDETWQEDQPPVIESISIPSVDPVQKLKDFLSANPDVADIINS